MRTYEERVRLLHHRAYELQKNRLRMQLTAWSAVSCCLGLCLFVMMLFAGGMNPLTAEGSYAGASLLSDSAGGYVLVAVAAFMAGVIITAAIKYYRRHRQ